MARKTMSALGAAAILMTFVAGCAPVGQSDFASRGTVTPAAAPAAGAPLARLVGVESFNAFRSTRRLPQLQRNATLDRVAAVQATDMARNNFFSHTGSDGSSVGQRARRSGYRFCRIAENLAVGARDVPHAVRLWEQSPGHLSTMLNRDVREYGMATSGPYTVLVVGRSGC